MRFTLIQIFRTNDVSDVMTCITHAEKLTNNQGIPIIDSTRMSIVGGSHGGFLGSHLIGQFPDLFKAAALRNPVTNIPAMFSITDIPDWCHVETRGNDAFDFTSFNVPSQESISIAYRKSPIFYIGRVKTPTLLCIGAKDRRVPCSQGIEYYHALQSRGVPSKMLYFPEDVHAIDKPASEAEQWVQVADFISKYTESE
jgi:acylaminoacyl-peptidase